MGVFPEAQLQSSPAATVILHPHMMLQKAEKASKSLMYVLRLAPIFFFLPFSLEYQNQQSFNDISTASGKVSFKVFLILRHLPCRVLAGRRSMAWVIENRSHLECGLANHALSAAIRECYA